MSVRVTLALQKAKQFMLLQLTLKSSTLAPRKVRHVEEEHTSNRGTVFIQFVTTVQFAKKAKTSNKGCTSNKVITGDIHMDLKSCMRTFDKIYTGTTQTSLCSSGCIPVMLMHCIDLCKNRCCLSSARTPAEVSQMLAESAGITLEASTISAGIQLGNFITLPQEAGSHPHNMGSLFSCDTVHPASCHTDT